MWTITIGSGDVTVALKVLQLLCINNIVYNMTLTKANIFMSMRKSAVRPHHLNYIFIYINQ